MAQWKPHFERHESAWSASLRRIGHFVQKRKYSLALTESNQLLAQSALPGHQQSRVLALVGDGEFKRGRFREAAQIQLQAATKSVNHATLWLRPHVGQVRALLKVPQVDQALVMARQAVALAEAKMAGFDEQVRGGNLMSRHRMHLVVSDLPPRVSVVATRMGYLFLQEGEPEAAREFFERAIQSAKGGANRARQGLALIARSNGEFEKVAQISAEAIRKGHYHVKTLPAWANLIAARRKSGCWRVSDRLIKGLDSAPATLRARTVMTIVSELRNNDMRQWRKVAEEWVEKEGADFPQYEKNIRKLFLASAKREVGNAAGRRDAAERLLRIRRLGRRDWLQAAKELTKAALEEGQAVDVERLLSDAHARYGEKFIPLATHGLALSCWSVNRPDLARPMLQSNIQQCNPGHARWCKSVWALARMEEKLNHPLEAAQAYLQFSEAKGVPDRFRLQAQLRWAQQVIASGDANAFWEAHVRMTQTLSRVNDPEVLMNFARQLQFGPSELRAWGQELFRQGEALALKQFNDATHPAVAINILRNLTRRQVLDFGRGSVAVWVWDGMDDQKKDWLWSESAAFWEYLGYLYAAFLQVHDDSGAEAFANAFMEDPASTASGLPNIGIPYARHLIDEGRAREGLGLFERMVGVAPRHPQCAWAWYWLALNELRKSEMESAKGHARNIRAGQGLHPGTLNGWRLDVRALLILADLDPARVELLGTPYAQSFVHEQRACIADDLQKVPE